ncbi:MAG: pyridoxamine 5'-phosphate oxidase family protein [Pseudomonadota bacterium]|nr:pyridoxamine 5'-phosphate oxidase family protein [Pseudomonadota bacterium]
MSLAMSPSERQAFLADLHVGVISLPDPERGPLTAPIWYDYRPDRGVWVLFSPDSRKGKLANVGTRISLVVQSENPPYKYVSVEGPITSIEKASDDELEAMAIRYLGDEMGKAYAAEGAGTSVTASMSIERWLTVDYAKRG